MTSPSSERKKAMQELSSSKAAVMPKVQPPELKGFMDKRLSGKIAPLRQHKRKYPQYISAYNSCCGVSCVLLHFIFDGMCMLLQWP